MGGMITAMTAPNSTSGTAILLSLSRMNIDVGRRSSTKWAKKPAIRKNAGIRHAWMKSNTTANRTDWSSSAGQMYSKSAMRRSKAAMRAVRYPSASRSL